MKRIMLFVLFSILAACGCKKNNPQPQQPPQPDGAASMLKEVIVQNLPSPYFHFTYNAENYVTQISFASGFSIYDVQYSGKNVKQLTNTQNGNTLLYTYTGPHVSEIVEISAATRKPEFSYRFSYNEGGMLKEVLWYAIMENTPALFKKAELVYYPDGNLASIQRYRDSSGSLNWAGKETFSDYDDKINPDGFYLLKTDFFESLLFLPQVRFQRNNPRKREIFGVVNDYEISYTYQYRQNETTSKTATMLQTRGADKGRIRQFTDHFNYY